MFDACCCIDVDDPLVPIREEMRTARKVHKCVECGREIKPGERYRYECGKSYERLETYKTCSGCYAMRRDRMSCGWYYGRIWEDLAECLRDSSPCGDLSWLHPMFEGTGDDCECEECWPEGRVHKGNESSEVNDGE